MLIHSLLTQFKAWLSNKLTESLRAFFRESQHTDDRQHCRGIANVMLLGTCKDTLIDAEVFVLLARFVVAVKSKPCDSWSFTSHLDPKAYDRHIACRRNHVPAILAHTGSGRAPRMNLHHTRSTFHLRQQITNFQAPIHQLKRREEIGDHVRRL
jgi:hypothetical protein